MRRNRASASPDVALPGGASSETAVFAQCQAVVTPVRGIACQELALGCTPAGAAQGSSTKVPDDASLRPIRRSSACRRARVPKSISAATLLLDRQRCARDLRGQAAQTVRPFNQANRRGKGIGKAKPGLYSRIGSSR